jgi:membrane protein implicated in regulation of membrane protease activity
MGAGAAEQWLIAAALGIIGTILLQRWKRGLAARTPAQQGLDIGQMVQVQSWGPDGTARVSYRGSTWDAELASTGLPQAKTMYIAAMRGSVLILSDRRPEALPQS